MRTSGGGRVEADKRGRRECMRTVRRAREGSRSGSLQYDDTERQPRRRGASLAASNDSGSRHFNCTYDHDPGGTVWVLGGCPIKPGTQGFLYLIKSLKWADDDNKKPREKKG